MNKRKAFLAENCQYRSKEYLDQMICLRESWYDIMRAKWNNLGIEAIICQFIHNFNQYWLLKIICPVYPHVAFKVKNALEMNPMMDYTIMWNIFHYPSGSLPVTTVQEEEVRDPKTSYQDGIEDNFTRAIRDQLREIKFQEMIWQAVQVVGLSHQDELVLGVMKAIDSQIKFRKFAKLNKIA